MNKKPNERASTLSDLTKKIKEKGGLVQQVSGKGDYKWKDTRLPENERLIPENIKNQIKVNREMDQLAEGANKFKEEQAKIIKEEALKKSTSKLPTDAIYDKTGKITDLKGKPHKFTKLKSMLGILPAAAAAALAAYAPESKAATIAQKVADEGDPTSLLFPEGAGEGEDDEVMKMRDEQKDKYFDNLMRNVPKNEKVRSEIELKKEVAPMVKILGGNPDMNPSKALKFSGEKPSPDIEDMDNSVNYEDYLKKKKRQFGYE